MRHPAYLLIALLLRATFALVVFGIIGMVPIIRHTKSLLPWRHSPFRGYLLYHRWQGFTSSLKPSVTCGWRSSFRSKRISTIC